MANNRESTYQRILDVLKRKGGELSVGDLCQALNLSTMAIHRQLNLLEGEKLIFSRKEKQKTGRPLRRYFLTEKGHQQFRRDYARLASDLLVQIRSMDGKSKINELLEMRKKNRLDEALAGTFGKTLEARLQEVTRLLNEDGYMATWEKTGPDQYLIKLMNCAVEQVARKFPQFCVSEEEFLAEFLQVKVRRRHHLLQKHQFCSYLVEA